MRSVYVRFYIDKIKVNVMLKNVLSIKSEKSVCITNTTIVAQIRFKQGCKSIDINVRLASRSTKTGINKVKYHAIPFMLTPYVAQKILSGAVSCAKRVRHACQTHMSCIFLRICHVSTCRVHFNVVVDVSVQHSLLLCHNVLPTLF